MSFVHRRGRAGVRSIGALAPLLLALGACGSASSARDDGREAGATDGAVDGDRLRDGGTTPSSDSGPSASRIGRSLLAVGLTHTCAVWPDRSVRCWGANDRGQLGDGTTTPRPTPEPVVGLRNVVEVTAGISHSCALLEDGTIHCWGYDSDGQLGDGDASLEPRTRPVRVAGVLDAIRVTAGSEHSCALLADHTVRCWGRNASSELGDGTATQRTTVVAVVGLDDAEEVSAGMRFTCARIADGTVRCWGEALAVVLPDGSVPTNAVPVAVPSLTRVVEIDAGYDHVCARLDDGTVRCWGWNANGALGDGSPTHRLEPVPIVDFTGAITNVVEIAAGRNTCARLGTGEVLCTGEVYYARSVVGIEGAEEIGVGSHECARLADGSFRCWGGTNGDGESMAGGCCHAGLCGIPEGAMCGVDGGTCEALWCSACGFEGTPCCDIARIAGRRCRDDRSLCTDGGICVACGGLGEPCCQGETSCDAAGTVCFRGLCAQPGVTGGPCATGDVCMDGCCVLEGHSERVCVSVGAACTGPDGAPERLCAAGASCGGCGGSGEPCCPSESTRVASYCSAPGLSCGPDEMCSAP